MASFRLLRSVLFPFLISNFCNLIRFIVWIFQGESGKLQASVDRLLNEEKQMRLAENVAGTRKAATEILQLCFDAKDWKLLNEQILNLSKKRGQLKQVLRFLVWLQNRLGKV